jgi:heat shock protein HslJ
MCPSTPLNKRLPKDFEYVRSYTLKEGHLVLSLMADGGIYEFELMNSASSTTPQSFVPLENTNWTLTQLATTSVTADAQHGPNITFNSEQHRVRGSGGCNRIMGGYTLEGDRVKFTQMASSMMACVSGMDTERAFLDALGNADSWKITGDKLELYDASGTAVATFQSAPAKQ